MGSMILSEEKVKAFSSCFPVYSPFPTVFTTKGINYCGMVQKSAKMAARQLYLSTMPARFVHTQSYKRWNNRKFLFPIL